MIVKKGETVNLPLDVGLVKFRSALPLVCNVHQNRRKRQRPQVAIVLKEIFGVLVHSHNRCFNIFAVLFGKSQLHN